MRSGMVVPALLGVVAAAGYPPWGTPAATMAAFTAACVWIGRLDRRGIAAGAGVAFALGLLGALLIRDARFGATAWTALNLSYALPYSLVGTAMSTVGRPTRRTWAFRVTSTWILVEAVRTRWSVGLPAWEQLGYIWRDTVVMRAAAVVGEVGLTGLTILACGGAALALLPVPPSRRPSRGKGRLKAVRLQPARERLGNGASARGSGSAKLS